MIQQEVLHGYLQSISFISPVCLKYQLANVSLAVCPPTFTSDQCLSSRDWQWIRHEPRKAPLVVELIIGAAAFINSCGTRYTIVWIILFDVRCSNEGSIINPDSLYEPVYIELGLHSWKQVTDNLNLCSIYCGFTSCSGNSAMNMLWLSRFNYIWIWFKSMTK